MTLRIEKAAARHKTIIRLSDRLQSEHLDELKMQVNGEQSPIAFGPRERDARRYRDRSISECLRE